MYCVKCGETIPENSKFCTKCGVIQHEPIAEETIEEKNFSNKEEGGTKIQIIKKVKEIVITFFSKNPFSLLDNVKTASIYGSSILIGIYVLVFAVVINNNIFQIVNYILGNLSNIINSKFGSYYSFPEIKIPITYDIFIPLLIIAMGTIFLEIVGFYIVKLYKKQKERNIIGIINIISISTLPIIIGLILNFVVGFVFAPLIIGIFVASVAFHLIILYKGLKAILEIDNEPIWEYWILVLVISSTMSIVLFVVMNLAMENIFTMIEDLVNNSVNGILNGLDNIFSF